MMSAAVANREALSCPLSHSEEEEDNTMSAAVANRQALSCRPSSPSEGEEEEEEEKKGGSDKDAVCSLSTCSMSSNNPTPDNPLYAATVTARDVAVPKNDNNNETNTNTNETTTTTTSFLPPISSVTTGGLHADFNKSPEPVRRQAQRMMTEEEETKTTATAAAADEKDIHNYHLLYQIQEDVRAANTTTTCITNAIHHDGENENEAGSGANADADANANANANANADTDTDANTDADADTIMNATITARCNMINNKSDNNIQSSSTKSSLPISPLRVASPIGASLLRNRNNINININNDDESFNNNNNLRRDPSPPTMPPPNRGFSSSSFSSSSSSNSSSTLFFIPQYTFTKIAYAISKRIFADANDDFAVAAWLGFWAYLNVSCANFVLKPIMDAVVLQLGVENLGTLISASSFLAFLSSVPIGWLFEAPDPSRRKVFKKMGMTRGETQGTSLALFYRFFALSALSYAVGFQLVDFIQNYGVIEWIFGNNDNGNGNNLEDDNNNSYNAVTGLVGTAWKTIPYLLKKWGQFMYIAFFLVIHLMRLHSSSLVWGVTTEAMEYEEIARKQHELNSSSKSRSNHHRTTTKPKKEKTRLQRLARIQFGGTLGGIWGSILASSLAKILHLPGLLVVSACLLEISAQLSIELGRIMQKHWEEQQIYKSNQDLTSLDPSMKRSASVGSMKRVASGNSLYASQQLQQQQSRASSGSLMAMANSEQSGRRASEELNQCVTTPPQNEVIDDNTFTQRLMRGVTTILSSRLLLTIFTYNALLASITTLLSFQRAELVANRKKDTTVSADTAFLANVNMASQFTMFAVQMSGVGALITTKCGTRGSLALMPFIRLGGLICLCWWHRSTNGLPPNLTLFLMLDEFTKVINLSVAKPVRESLWSDLNSEARYEAKPIIDVLANRWGAGSASFCVAVVSRVLLFLGQTNNDNGENSNPVLFGLPPVLVLGLIVAAWWVGVSLDLGQLRARIDLELKKHR